MNQNFSVSFDEKSGSYEIVKKYDAISVIVFDIDVDSDIGS